MRRMRHFMALLLSFCGIAAMGQLPTPSDAPTANEWAANTHWYLISLKSSGGYLSTADGYVGSDGYLKATNSTAPTADEGTLDKSLWCVVGDETDGYKFYNKAAGTSSYLGQTGSGSNARIKIYTEEEISNSNSNSTTVTYLFTVLASNNSGYAYVIQGTSGNNAWNKDNNTGYLALWNSANVPSDNGSSFLFDEVDEATLGANEETERTELQESFKYWTNAYNGYNPEGVDAYTIAQQLLATNSGTLTTAQLIQLKYAKQNLDAAAATHMVLPQAGDFLRIVSANTNKAYLGAENITFTFNNNKTYTTEQFINTPDNTKTVFFYDGSTLENYSNGYLLANSTTNGYPMLCNNGVTNGSVIKFKAANTGTMGQYNITFNNGGRYLYAATYSDGSPSGCVAGNSPDTTTGYRFTLEKVDTLDVTIGEAGYATFFAPVSVTLPEGLSAYAGTVDGDAFDLTEVEETIPARTGVILKGTAGTYRLPIVAGSYDDPAAAAADADNTKLTGTVATILSSSVADATIFTLQKRDEGIGLYPFGTETGSDTTTDTSELKGFKAYLTQSSASSVRGFLFDGEAVTAIDALTTDATPTDTATYDLSGRRVNAAAHGLYISGGKKVIIR